MKTIYYIIFFTSLLFSCSSGGGGGNEELPENTAPSVPALVYPSNSQLCIENVITLKWSASTDAEGNTITYKIQVAKDNQFTQGVSNKQTSSIQQVFSLEKGQTYYWRVQAVDSDNASSAYSPTYGFYTEGDAQSNHLPFLPEVVNPVYNATVSASSAVLEWTASDPDTNDALSYDVYLDTVNPPVTNVTSNATANTLDVSSMLQASNVYYWQVVVKDDKGGETKGQVWSFDTN